MAVVIVTTISVALLLAAYAIAFVAAVVASRNTNLKASRFMIIGLVGLGTAKILSIFLEFLSAEKFSSVKEYYFLLEILHSLSFLLISVGGLLFVFGVGKFGSRR